MSKEITLFPPPPSRGGLESNILLAERLRMCTVAKGIEAENEVDLIRSLGLHCRARVLSGQADGTGGVAYLPSPEINARGNIGRAHASTLPIDPAR